MALRMSQTMWNTVTSRQAQRARIVVKRVVAIGGDTIDLGNRNLAINGAEIPIPLGRVERKPFLLRVQQGELFVVGDYHVMSYDSRTYGPVRARSVVGIVRVIVWPPRRVRYLRPAC